MAPKKAVRGFRIVKKAHMKFPEEKTILPVRVDARSGGYNFFAKENYVISQGKKRIFWMDIKAYMQDDEVLMLFGVRKDSRITDDSAIINPNHYGNVDDDGNIGICIQNTGNRPLIIKKGECIAQGIFMKYLIADRDTASKEKIDDKE